MNRVATPSTPSSPASRLTTLSRFSSMAAPRVFSFTCRVPSFWVSKPSWLRARSVPEFSAGWVSMVCNRRLMALMPASPPSTPPPSPLITDWPVMKPITLL